MYLKLALTFLSQIQPVNDPNCPVEGSAGCNTNLPQVGADRATIQPILTIFFGILGLIAVVMLIISGIKFITAQGEPQKIKDARNTIIWSLIGLAIAVSAEVIVYLLLGKL